LTDRSSVGEARRAAATLAQTLGFEADRRNDIAIAATELANNVILHAQSGELLLCWGGPENARWIDITALDEGPGIPDIGRAMEDGYSTIGTAGQGLGAVARLADKSALYSTPSKGAVYWSRFTPTRSETPGFGVVSIPVRGETALGDGHLAIPGTRRSLYMVVDGLGHGQGAAEAAEEAIRVVLASAGETLADMLAAAHDALKKTRGAAMSIAVADHEQRILTYAGVGNVGGLLVTGSTVRSLSSQNGTLGAAMPRVCQELTFPIESQTLLIMHSDGLASRTAISPYTGIQGRHPALIAGLLYRDFTRKRDDATVLVARMEGPQR
jgi:anti-sigma regulatory factor (Ser/Thr protein kinase)